MQERGGQASNSSLHVDHIRHSILETFVVSLDSSKKTQFLERLKESGNHQLLCLRSTYLPKTRSFQEKPNNLAN